MQLKPHFVYRRRIRFSETDAMGVMHHANYICLFEEARVEYMRQLGLLRIHLPYGDLVFAVAALSNRFQRSLRFDEEVAVHVQCRVEGVRVLFRYAVWSLQHDVFIGDGDTVLAPVGLDLKLKRLPAEVRLQIDSQRWDESWPPKSSRDYQANTPSL